MALILADRVKVRSFTTGTGTFALSDAYAGFRTFAAVGDGNDTFYGIVDTNNNWEIGRGAWSQITNTLSRDTVLSSSNSNSLVNFPEGGKTVYSTFPAEAASDFTYTTSVETAVGGATIRLSRSDVGADDIAILGTGGVVVTRTDASTITLTTDLSSTFGVAQSAETTSGGAILRLSQGGANDDISVIGSSGVVVTRTDADTITITSDISVTQSAETTTGGAILRLDQSGVTDDVSFIGDTGIVVTRTDANTITLTSDIAQSAETTAGGAILRLDKTGTTDDITFQGNNGVEVSRVDANTIKIDATEASGLAIVMGL